MTSKAKRRAQKRQARELQAATAAKDEVRTRGSARAARRPRARPNLLNTAVDLFAENCGVCHTLRPPGTTGTAGPNLNRLRPSAARVLAAIRNGGRGSGLMPPGILTGRDAERVALF